MNQNVEPTNLAKAAFQHLLSYEQRARAFNPGKGQQSRGSGDWSGVTFRIGESRLTCSIERVHEFIPPPPVTRVPGAKPWILGLANVRGDLVTVIDLAGFLTGELSTVTVRTRLLSATLRGRPVGLLVDEVYGHRSFVRADDPQPATADGEALEAYVQRSFRSGKEMWRELDLDVLFNTPEFLNGSGA